VRATGKNLISGGIGMILALAVALPAAYADPSRDRRGREPQRPGSEQSERQSREVQRAQRSEEQRQRLSPEERRQLRRDVQDAGREIYPPRR